MAWKKMENSGAVQSYTKWETLVYGSSFVCRHTRVLQREIGQDLTWDLSDQSSHQLHELCAGSAGCTYGALVNGFSVQT